MNPLRFKAASHLLALTLLLLLSTLCQTPAQAPAPARQTLRGHIPPVAAHLTPIGRPPATQRLNLAIGLPLRNRESLTNLLQALYDPANPLFHQYLTPADFTERFGPSDADYQALVAFAQTNGFTVSTTHPNRVLLDVNATVADIERTLHLTLRTYQHPTEARTFYAPDTEPSLDFSVPLLDISGLSDYGRPHPLVRPTRASPAPSAAQPLAGSGSGGTYLGNDFRTAYAPGVSLTGAGQVVGLLQFDGYYASDITAYESQAGLPNVPLQNVLLDGYNGVPTTGANSGNIEVSLDIEMVISMAPGISKIIMYEAGPSGTPNDILNRMATDNLAKQLSCSWGWTGGPTTTTDQIFQQMNAQGQTFFSASGDSDAYVVGEIDKSTNSDTPSDNPYITIVGGTTLSTTGPGGAWTGETVWNWGLVNGNYVGSSGGYSSHYTLPTWQQGISMTANQGSTTYRNIPDVALTADNVYVVYNGNATGTSVGGTSCAAPLWAGFTALMNQQAAAGGKPPVGFLNPALYSLGKGTNYTGNFHDITTGNNFSSSSPSLFSAVSGYDLCTGWGTPNGSTLINSLVPIAYVPVVTNAGYVLLAESCMPTNGAVDPGETVTVNFALQNLGLANTTNLVATLQTSGSVLSPSAPQSYGVLTGLGPSVSRPFTFTANGTCGGTVTATFQLQDGPTSYGTVSFPLTLGQAIGTAANQNFDGVTAPALPAGWSTLEVTLTNTANPWTTASTSYDTGPNAAFITDSTNLGANALVSPVLTLPPTASQITFRHNYNLETHRQGNTRYNYDGAVLEIQINGGGFMDILSAGGSFVTGGYNGTITTTSDNPLGGRSAWVGSSSGWITTTLNLPTAAAGQNVQLRWNCATDSGNSYGGAGWYVDSIATSSSYYVCCSGITNAAPQITLQPTNVTVLPGANASFMVSATGSPAPAYQWRWNGAPLNGATNSTLSLTVVQPSQAGIYTVVVTNAVGTVTSAPASLRVLVPPTLGGITTAGSHPSLSFQSLTGLTYTLEYKHLLSDPAWTLLPPPVTGTGGPLQLQDTNPMTGSRFYRVRCE